MKLILFLLIITPIFLSCRRSTEPLIELQDLQLSVEDVSCTEVWLSLKMKDDFLGKTLKLYRNDSLVISKKLTAADSMFVDNELEPSTTYSYSLRIENVNKLLAKSTLISATTLDTTSHDFTWQSYEFGGKENSSSVLFDVAIVDENDIWAVGEIHTDETDRWNEDSTEWIPPFNAVHWDGDTWHLKRIQKENHSGWGPLYTISIFGINGIFVGGSIPLYSMDGDKWEFYGPDEPAGYEGGFGINKIWGSSINDIYAVGNQGQIRHYNGQSWQRLESGTDIDIQDIWGAKKPNNGETEILAVVSNKFQNDGKVILQIKNEKAVPIQTNGLPVSLSGIWSVNGKKWYVCGDGLFSNRLLNDQWQTISGIPLIFHECIRGNASNDIFTVGHLGLVLHWNGVTWLNFSHEPGDSFYGLAVKGDVVTAVGNSSVGIVAGSAKILIGKRN